MSAAWFSTRPEPDPPVSLLRLGALSGFALQTPWLCHLSYHRLSAMNYVVRAASPSWHVPPLIPVPEKQHRSFSWNGLHTIITTINMPLLVIWVWSPWQLIHLSLWAGGGGDSPADLAPQLPLSGNLQEGGKRTMTMEGKRDVQSMGWERGFGE